MGLVVSLVASLLAVAPAASAAPVNDDFPGKTIVAVPFSTSVDTRDATTAADEPEPCGPAGATVWWNYTPASDGFIGIGTRDSGFDTVLAVYTSGPDGLSVEGCNDDTPPGTTSHLELAVAGGVTYYIQAGGYAGASGALALAIHEQTPLSNDDLPGTTISNVPYSATVSTRDATTSPTEPQPGCAPIGATVWWNYTSPGDERVEISTIGSSFDTVLAVYVSDGQGWSQVACDDDGGGQGRSRLEATFRAGVTYYIQAGGYAHAAGTLALDVGFSPGGNDDFPGQLVSQVPFLREQSTSEATLEDGEPTRACTPEPVGATVWFSYTAATADAIVFDTSGSSYDTVLTLFTRNEDGSLAFVACNDDYEYAELWESRLVFVPTPGTTYYVQVGGYTWPNESPARGSLRFSMEHSRCPTGPPDDGPASQELHELEWPSGPLREPLHAVSCGVAAATGL